MFKFQRHHRETLDLMENQCAVFAFLELGGHPGGVGGAHSLGVVVDYLAVQFVLMRDALVGLEVEVQHRHGEGKPGPGRRDDGPLIGAGSKKAISDPQVLSSPLRVRPHTPI